MCLLQGENACKFAGYGKARVITMTFYVENETEVTFPFDVEEIVEQVAEAVLDAEECPYETQVNVLLTDNEGIHEFNREHRGIDRETDVLSFPNVDFETEGDFDIDEDKGEHQRQNAEGEYVSYIPPRYYWDYDFTMNIRVKHPYFDDMRFDLNGSSVRVEPNYGAAPTSFGRFGMGSQFDPTAHPDYLEYANMGNEIKALLTQMRQNVRDSVNAANAPKQRVNCPACGATTIPDAHGCCEYCGSALK